MGRNGKVGRGGMRSPFDNYLDSMQLRRISSKDNHLSNGDSVLLSAMGIVQSFSLPSESDRRSAKPEKDSIVNRDLELFRIFRQRYARSRISVIGFNPGPLHILIAQAYRRTP